MALATLTHLGPCSVATCSKGKCNIINIQRLNGGCNLSVPAAALGRQTCNHTIRRQLRAGRLGHACKLAREYKAAAAQLLSGELPRTREGRPASGEVINRDLFRDSSCTLGPDPAMLDTDEHGNMVNVVPNARDYHLSHTRCIKVHPLAMYPELGPFKCLDCGHQMHQDGPGEGVREVLDVSKELNTVMYGWNWSCQYCPKDPGRFCLTMEGIWADVAVSNSQQQLYESSFSTLESDSGCISDVSAAAAVAAMQAHVMPSSALLSSTHQLAGC